MRKRQARMGAREGRIEPNGGLEEVPGPLVVGSD